MKDKVIAITGASSGIGAALAVECARRGAKVVLAARRESELASVAASIGSSALPFVTDVTRRADHERLREAAIAKFGHLDVLVANAGRGISRAVSQLTDADLDDMVTTNVKSVIYGVQAVLPHFKARKQGHVLAVSSMLSRLPLAPIRSAYSASKAALNMLMASLRQELATEFPDIHVTTVLPGVVATEFGTNALHGGPDSRKLPGAQPVEEVATVIADAIDSPRAEVYTRAQMKDMLVRFYSADDVAAVEKQFIVVR
jgi:NADP-dependent 3-hydroxy acid dehydrogenase YdfG